MKAYIFPGQGAQFTGMGLDLYENSPEAQHLFEDANSILGFNITDIMFEGSAEDLKETLFDPFVTSKPIGVGTGMGLAVSHRIIASHGGTISVDSSASGTVFSLHFPLQSTIPVESQPA